MNVNAKINPKVANRLKNMKKEFPREIMLGIRVTKDIHNALLLRASAEKKDVSATSMARNIIENELFNSDEKTLKTSLLNIHNKSDRLENLLVSLHWIFENYIHTFFSLHPEIPNEDKVSVSEKSFQRKETFYKLSANSDNIGMWVEKMIANSLKK